MKTLKLGLLVDSPFVSKYVYELGQWASHQKDIQITHLIVHEGSSEKNLLQKFLSSLLHKGLNHSFSQAAFFILHKIESLMLKRDKIHQDHLRMYDLSQLIDKQIHVNPIRSKSGISFRLSGEDLGKMKATECDLFIRCGSGILRGEILNIARFGIISFHHADNRVNRGGPPGFWEVYFRQDTTGFTLQRLTEELDGGEVFARGAFGTKFHYLLNQAGLFKQANSHLMLLLKKIAQTDRLPSRLPSYPYVYPLFRRPNLGQIFFYGITLTGRILKKSFYYLLAYRYRWGVAFSRTDWRHLVMWRGIKLKNPPRHFLADPFVIHQNGKDVCFVEDYDYAKKRGCISAYALGEKSSQRLGVAVEEPFHMSFPFVFEFEGQTYMCPETSENRDIRVYRCVEFPMRWKLEKILMKNLSAVDTMLFERDSKWWMMTNIDSSESGEHCSELFLFSAQHPLSDQWVAHPLNPVLVDATCARNGGMLRDENTLYRIAQGQGFDLYGRRCAIREIIVLSQSQYEERSVAQIAPEFFKGLKGTHHIHSNGKVTVFDFVSRNQTYS